MDALADQLLVVAILINFVILGTTRLAFAVQAVALQGVILGILPALLYPLSWHIAFIIVIIFLAKGVLIPLLINSAIHQAKIKREIEPFIGYISSLILGALCTALAFIFARHFPLIKAHQGHLLVPVSIATLMAGFLVLTTRRKAIFLVIGYLVMENGIFIFGLLLAEAMPTIVEAAAILDLLVGIFVMAIVMNHIGREFSSLDVSRLTTLKER